MSTNNQIDLVEFYAKSADDVAAATSFFSSAFGWEYKDWGGTYSDTQDSGLASGVNGTEGQMKAPLVVIYAADLDATKQKIVNAGGKILVDTYAFPGGRRFHFTDPLGNELAVWSE